jgi:hypothetical protein
MQGRTPTAKERKWMNAITQLGCIVCLLDRGVKSPTQIHHIDGKTKPDAHLNSIPLCYLHHQAGTDCCEYVSRHPYKARFVARYGTEQHLLAETKRLLKWEDDHAVVI